MGKKSGGTGTPTTFPPAQSLPTPQPSIPLNTAPPPPFQFAPRPTVTPYQEPPREFGSGTGAQPAFASQRPMGFDPVQSFLSSLPELGSTTPWVNNMTLPATPAVPAQPAQPGQPGQRAANMVTESVLARRLSPNYVSGPQELTRRFLTGR